MSNHCCNDKKENNACCTGNNIQKSKCCSNETEITNANNDCCTNSKSLDLTSNASNCTDHYQSKEDDEVATSYSNYNFKVIGMDCSSCAITIEKALSPLADVSNPKVNFSTSRLTVDLKAPSNIKQVTQTLKN